MIIKTFCHDNNRSNDNNNNNCNYGMPYQVMMKWERNKDNIIFMLESMVLNKSNGYNEITNPVFVWYISTNSTMQSK